MQNLFTGNFWFDKQPPALLPLFENLLTGLVVIFVIAVFVFARLKKKKNPYQKTWQELFNFSLTNAFIGLILMFFNYETIAFFSARFWFLIWALIIIVWLVFIVKQIKKIPERRKAIEKEKELKKYIP